MRNSFAFYNCANSKSIQYIQVLILPLFWFAWLPLHTHAHTNTHKTLAIAFAINARSSNFTCVFPTSIALEFAKRNNNNQILCLLIEYWSVAYDWEPAAISRACGQAQVIWAKSRELELVVLWYILWNSKLSLSVSLSIFIS